MKYKVVKDSFYGWNIKWKKYWFMPWRYVMSDIVPEMIYRTHTKEEAEKFVRECKERSEFRKKMVYFDPIP